MAPSTAKSTQKTKKAPPPQPKAKALKKEATAATPAAASNGKKGKAVAAIAPAKPEAKVKGKGKAGKGCSEPGCSLPQMSDLFCRLHYIKNWSIIISGRRAQARANLNKYIESLSEKFPDEYMEKIRDDLGSEGTFHARLRELGFREEYESGGGGDNPFQMENFDEFVHGLKFED